MSVPVQVKDLTRRFGRQVVLRQVSFHLPAGSSTLILGANGSGKTTLLRVLSLRLRPTRGQVCFDSIPWEEADGSVRARIGVLGHGSMLYGAMSGRENLRFHGRMFCVDRLEQRVEAALEGVGMLAEADRPVERCSQGMRQRLALARATLHDPGLLLLDEPFSGLDREAAGRLIEQLAAARAGGRTLALVTHAPGRVAEHCDRVVVLRRGRVAHEGPFDGDGEALEALLRSHQDGPQASSAGGGA